MHQKLKRLCFAFIAVGFAACGGEPGSETTSPPTSTPDEEPTIAVVFPTANANLGTGKNPTTTTVIVRSSPASAITELSVNDLTLTADSHDPDLWYGKIPVVFGHNTLHVLGRTETGESVQAEQIFTNTNVQLPERQAFVATEDDRQYLIDSNGHLNEWLADTGELRLYGEDQCLGPLFEIDSNGYRAYLLSHFGLCEIDLPTGAASTTVLQTLSSPEELLKYKALHLNRSQNMLYISQYISDIETLRQGYQIIKVHPVTHESTLVFDGTAPANAEPNPLLQEMRNLVVDADAGIAYFYSPTAATTDASSASGLVALNLASGEANLVTAIDNRAARYVLVEQDELHTLDEWGIAMEAVNLATGEITELQPQRAEHADLAQVGTGPKVEINSLAINDAGDTLYATSDSGLYRIDIATGERELVAPLDCSGKCEIELDADVAYVSETQYDRRVFYGIDLNSGTKTLVSGLNQGDGELPYHAVGMALDKAHNRLLVADFRAPEPNADVLAYDYGLVMNIDLATGNRQNFWWSSDGKTGPTEDDYYALYPAADLWVDSTNECTYVWAPVNDLILTFTGPTERPTAPRFMDPLSLPRSSAPGYSAMAIDESRDVLYLTNRDYAALARQPLRRADSDGCYQTGEGPTGDVLARGSTGVQLPSANSPDATSNGSIALDANNQIAYMVTEDNAVVAVSLFTGDRVVVSK